jgi:hypothetical protein
VSGFLLLLLGSVRADLGEPLVRPLERLPVPPDVGDPDPVVGLGDPVEEAA